MEEASWKIVYIVTYRLYFQTTYQVIAHRYSITVANISFKSVITLERRGKGGEKTPTLESLWFTFPLAAFQAPTDTRVNSAAIYILLGTTRTRL